MSDPRFDLLDEHPAIQALWNAIKDLEDQQFEFEERLHAIEERLKEGGRP